MVSQAANHTRSSSDATTYVDGVKTGVVVFHAKSNSAGGVVMFDVSSGGMPVMSEIIDVSVRVVDSSAVYSFGPASLAGDGLSVSMPVKVQKTTGTTVVGISVLASIAMIDPPSPVLCKAVITGKK